MSSGNELSRLEQAEAQVEMFPEGEVDALAAHARHPMVTGEYLFRNHPKIYRAIVRLRGRAFNLHEIAELLGVSVNTVRAVAQREGQTVDSEKEESARHLRRVGSKLIARIESDVESDAVMSETSLRDKAIAFGVITDKAQLLAGEATSIVEVQRHEVGPDAWERAIKQALPAAPMGLGGSGSAANAALPAPIEGHLIELQAPAPKAVADSQSDAEGGK